MVLNAPSGSADIAFNYEDTILAIPNTSSGQLLFLPMRDPDRDLYSESGDNCPDVYNPDQSDADGDGIGDAVFLISYIFHDGPASTPPESADVNCDEGVNVGDAVYLLNFAFRDDSPEPCAW
jgi:hypothetical protein